MLGSLKAWLKTLLDVYLLPMELYNVRETETKNYFLKIVVPLFMPSFLIPSFYILSEWVSGLVLYSLLIPGALILVSVALSGYLLVLRAGLYILGAPESREASKAAVYTLPFFVLIGIGYAWPFFGFALFALVSPYQAYLVSRAMRKRQILGRDRAIKLAKKIIWFSYIGMFTAVSLYFLF